MSKLCIKSKVRKSTEIYIAFEGTYLPVECGIATFTKDLRREVKEQFSNVHMGGNNELWLFVLDILVHVVLYLTYLH